MRIKIDAWSIIRNLLLKAGFLARWYKVEAVNNITKLAPKMLKLTTCQAVPY